MVQKYLVDTKNIHTEQLRGLSYAPAFTVLITLSLIDPIDDEQEFRDLVFSFPLGQLGINQRSITMSSPSKRREMDVMKLMMSDYAVETINDGIGEFNVEFRGPKDSPYEGGFWKVHVELPDAYPYKSPSIGFLNKIFHPNVDELSGSVCLDVINQTWSPMFDLLNVFEVFLPQLLLYPNPTDPLNSDAASLMMRDKQQFEQKVKEYCERYAKKEHITKVVEESSDDDDEATDGSNGESSGDEIAGHADP